MMGNSYLNSDKFKTYSIELGNGEIFRDAYLTQAQSNFSSSPGSNLILFGAGTLKAKAHITY